MVVLAHDNVHISFQAMWTSLMCNGWPDMHQHVHAYSTYTNHVGVGECEVTGAPVASPSLEVLNHWIHRQPAIICWLFLRNNIFLIIIII